MPVTDRFTSWSFTRYNDWRTCGLKAKLKHLLKIKEPKTEPLIRGGETHELAENYIKGKVPESPFPPELAKFKDEFLMLRKLYPRKKPAMIVEADWAFTKDWSQTTWDDWTKCWLRIKLDCAHWIENDILMVSDWKTGKFRPDQEETYLEQLQLYALAALLLHKHIKEVRVRLAYLDYGVVHPIQGWVSYFREDVPKLRKLWESRVKVMFADRKFEPKPNRWCGYCHFRKDNKKNGGGQCRF